MRRGMSWEEYFGRDSEHQTLEKIGVPHGETDPLIVVKTALDAFADGRITPKELAEVAYTAGSFSVMSKITEIGLLPGPETDIYSDDLTPDQK